MSVSSTSSSVSYTSNGLQTTYAIPFYFMAFTDLVVMVTTAGVTATSPITTGWVGTGTPNSMGAYNNGGDIVFQPGQIPANNATINVIRNTSRTQPLSFLDNAAFSGPSLENALDRLTLIEQEGGTGGISSILGGGFLGFAAGPPTSGNFVQGQFYLNNNQQPGQPFGWMCSQTGAPGTWNVITNISL